jgi:hypothetical protein
MTGFLKKNLSWGLCALGAVLMLAGPSLAEPLSISQDVSEVEAKTGSRSRKVKFKPFTLAEAQKLANGGAPKGARGKKTKLTNNFQVDVGSGGSRGRAGKVKLGDMIKNINAYGKRLAKLGIDLRKIKNGTIVERIKHNVKELKAAKQRADKGLAGKRPVVRKLPRWFSRFGKKRGARGKSDNPYKVSAKHKLTKKGSRGARGKSVWTWSKSKYPINFGNKKWVQAKAGAALTLTARDKKLELKASAEVSGAALNKSWTLVKAKVDVVADTVKDLTSVKSSFRWLNKDVKLPGWLNKTHKTKYEISKTWEKGINKSDKGKFDFGLCKGNYAYSINGKIGVNAALLIKTINISAQIVPFAYLKMAGSSSGSTCVGNKVGGEGQITVFDGKFTLAGDAGLGMDKTGLYVQANAFGKYQYTALKGYIGGWAQGWITDPLTWFGNLFKKKKNRKKLKKVKKQLWKGNGYTGTGFAFKLDSGKHYLKGTNNKVSGAASTSGKGQSGKRPKVVVKANKNFGKMFKGMWKIMRWKFSGVRGARGFIRLISATNPSHWANIEKGKPAVGKLWPTAQSAQWKRENVGKGYFRLKNRWKGTYLHIERGKVEVSKIHKGAFSAMWKLEVDRKNRGYVCLKNRWKGTYLTNAAGKLKVIKGKCN